MPRPVWDAPLLTLRLLERVAALPQDEQDAIASQILASIEDEDAWKKRFAKKRAIVRRMALEEDERGETLPLDGTPLMESRTTRRFWRLFYNLPLEVQADTRQAWRLSGWPEVDFGLFKPVYYLIRFNSRVYSSLSGKRRWSSARISRAPEAFLSRIAATASSTLANGSSR